LLQIKELKTLDQVNENQKETISHLERRLAQVEALSISQVAGSTSNLKDLEMQKNEAVYQVKELNEQVIELTEKLSQKENEISTLTFEKAAEISTLKQQLEAFVKEKDLTTLSLKKEIEQLKKRQGKGSTGSLSSKKGIESQLSLVEEKVAQAEQMMLDLKEQKEKSEKELNSTIILLEKELETRDKMWLTEKETLIQEVTDYCDYG
jgi:hypothetical protein